MQAGEFNGSAGWVELSTSQTSQDVSSGRGFATGIMTLTVVLVLAAGLIGYYDRFQPLLSGDGVGVGELADLAPAAGPDIGAIAIPARASASVQLVLFDAAGTAGSEILLPLIARTTGATDLQSLSITGLPPGATLSAGTATSEGSWTVGPDRMSDLSLTLPPDLTEDLDLTVLVDARERDSGATATAAGLLRVKIGPQGG